MEWLTTLVGGTASVAAGGIFGLIGSIVGVGAKYVQERQRQAWEKQKWDHEAQMLELQMKARSAETENELAIVSQQGIWSGLTASQQADTALTPHVHKWTNDVRALFRPVLTAGLVVVVYLIFKDLLRALGAGESILAQVLSKAQVQELLTYIVYTMAFAASTSIVWWFGDRALTPPGYKSR